MARDLRPEALFVPDDVPSAAADDDHEQTAAEEITEDTEEPCTAQPDEAVDAGAGDHDVPETAEVVGDVDAEVPEPEVALSEQEEAELVASVKALHAEIGDLENLLQEAAEAEDYDQAAAYSDRVEDIKRKIDEVMNLCIG